MKKILQIISMVALLAVGPKILAGQTLTIQPGDDVIVGVGASVDLVAHQPASSNSLSFKVGSIAGQPTYLTTVYEMTFANIQQVLRGSMPAGGAFIPKVGITQVIKVAPHLGLFVHTVGGVAKFDWATLSTFDGGVGLAWDVGGQFTKDKVHIYLAPFAKEVSISSLQVKPVYGVQVLTGFRKGQ